MRGKDLQTPRCYLLIAMIIVCPGSAGFITKRVAAGEGVRSYSGLYPELPVGCVEPGAVCLSCGAGDPLPLPKTPRPALLSAEPAGNPVCGAGQAQG